MTECEALRVRDLIKSIESIVQEAEEMQHPIPYKLAKLISDAYDEAGDVAQALTIWGHHGDAPPADATDQSP